MQRTEQGFQDPQRCGGNRPTNRRDRDGGVRPIGDVLVELLARYQVRFPEAGVTIVHTPAETM